jgi:hypothetical protein
MFIERRVLEVGDAQLELEDLPPDIRKKVKAAEAKQKQGGGITLEEARRRTQELMRTL